MGWSFSRGLFREKLPSQSCCSTEKVASGGLGNASIAGRASMRGFHMQSFAAKNARRMTTTLPNGAKRTGNETEGISRHTGTTFSKRNDSRSSGATEWFDR
jgi:hypothetical protein